MQQQAKQIAGKGGTLKENMLTRFSSAKALLQDQNKDSLFFELMSQQSTKMLGNLYSYSILHRI